MSDFMSKLRFYVFYNIGGTYVTIASVGVMLLTIFVCAYIAVRIIKIRK